MLRVDQCLRRLAATLRIVAHRGRNLVFLEQNEVWAFEAADRLTSVDMLHGAIDLNLSLSAIEASFGRAFARVHRNWLVRAAHTKELEREGETRIKCSAIGFEGALNPQGGGPHFSHFTNEAVFVSEAREELTPLHCDNVQSTRDVTQGIELGGVITLMADPTMLRVYELLRQLAKSTLPVMIVGETGTGKEHAARAVHYHSERRSSPLVAINCAAIPDGLFESEVFGYLRGAFSGAVNDKCGRFEVAHGGTIFLDEVGELSKMAQAKLLRFLEDGMICPVGGVQERKVDCRIVAATNQDLEADVRAGRFRQDLYFRLVAATITLPRLTERPLDIPILAHHFLRDACQTSQRPVPILSETTLLILQRYPFPGNVREIRNIMGYLAATSFDETIEPWHLPAHIQANSQTKFVKLDTTETRSTTEPPGFRPLVEEVEELEARRMREALVYTRGNQRMASELLAIPLRTFVTKIKRYGLRSA